MVRGIHRPTVAIIDCLAIYQNIKQEVARLDKQTELFAVVKADGYGHGAVQVAKIALDAGATGFCVAILDEALELRAAGFKEPILVMGVISAKDLKIVANEGISITIASNEWLLQAEEIYKKEQLTQKIGIHIKIDSGMGRIGYREVDEMREAVQLLSASQAFFVEGIFTHFSTADGSSQSYFEKQQEKFTQALEIFPKDLRYIHTANTATALWHEAWRSNMVRFGISVYGSNPSGTLLSEPYPLQEAMTLESELVHVKQIHAGDGVGYGAEYVASQTEWVGTVPIGYADGYRRDYKGFYVLIEGQKVPILGRICMDQLMIRLPKAYQIGTKVTLFGQNGGERISIQELAEHGDTINYEVTCDISSRVPRVYVNQNYLEMDNK